MLTEQYMMPINLLLVLIILYLGYFCSNTCCFYNQYSNIHLSFFIQSSFDPVLDSFSPLVPPSFSQRAPFSRNKMLYLWYSAWSRGLGDELEDGRELGRTDPSDEALSLFSSWPEVEDGVEEETVTPAEAFSCPL